jgi:hypothetical protein
MSAPPAAASLDAQIRDLRLFDGNCQIGPSDFTVFAAPTSVAQLTAEMDRHGIAEAVVYHAWAGALWPRLRKCHSGDRDFEHSQTTGLLGGPSSPYR